jgi:hypothetical protein
VSGPRGRRIRLTRLGLRVVVPMRVEVVVEGSRSALASSTVRVIRFEAIANLRAVNASSEPLRRTRRTILSRAATAQSPAA